MRATPVARSIGNKELGENVPPVAQSIHVLLVVNWDRGFGLAKVK